MKYKIEQNGQFLGHHMGHTPKEAIDKMLKSSYAECYNVNPNEQFVVIKSGKTQTVQL